VSGKGSSHQGGDDCADDAGEQQVARKIPGLIAIPFDQQWGNYRHRC
jgi:hypothetical protein